MDREELLPQLTSDLLKDAVEEVVRAFVESEGVFPKSIYLSAEGNNQYAISKLVVTKQIYPVVSIREKFL